MKRFKILIPLVVVLILFSFSFSCFGASNFEFTFREIMDAGGLTSTVFTSSGSELSITPTWNWANHLVTSVPSGTMSYRLETYSNNSDLFNVYGADNVLLLKINRFSIACNGFPNQNTVEYSLRFGFRFLLEDGTFQYVYSPLLSASSAGLKEPTWNRPYAYFDDIDLNINVPIGATRLYSIILDFHYPESIGSFIVGTWGGNLTFFVGSRSAAPVFTAPSLPSQDEYEDAEEELIDSTQGGFDDALTSFDSVTSFFSGQNAIYRGSLFMSAFFDHILHYFPWLNQLLLISLVLGVLIFVISGVSFFSSRR